MGILKKAAPIAAALVLGAGALFGNPLESTIVKEDAKKEIVDFTGNADNKSFTLDASLPMGNNWEWDFSSDTQFDTNFIRINNVDMALGNDRFFVGASFGDLSTETLLDKSNIMKVQAGLRPLDWLDFSATGAIVNLPDNTVDISALGHPLANIPLTLYALAGNLNMGQKIPLNSSLSLFPWFSAKASKYFADPTINDDFKTLDQSIPGRGAASMALPFDHLNVQAGLDLDINDSLKLSYKGIYEGQYYQYPIFNLTNVLGIQMHDKDKMNLEYDLSLITKPSLVWDGLLAPTRNELKFDLSGFYLFDNGLYLKAEGSALIDFLTQNQFNATAAIGWRFKNGGNIEAYFSSQFNPEDTSQNNVFGILYSTKLDKSTEKESRIRNSFKTSSAVNGNANLYGSQNAQTLHQRFGNTLEEAISNIHSEQDLSNLAAYIQYIDHDGTYSARYEYEVTGSGVCRDTNGNLLTYIEQKAFDYKSVRPISLRGAFVSHAVVAIETKDGKFNLRNYDQFYNLNAPTAQAAVDKVFPGSYIYEDGTVSSSVSAVRDAVEKPLYDWTKFRD